MIQDDLVLGKIDRLTRILKIMDNKTDDEVLDKWVNNINEIIDLVDFVTERIEREEITAWYKLFNLIIIWHEYF